jgi:N-acetyl-gamma-glutamyl-phosphate reductase
MNENIYPYSVGVHRHMPEIEQVVSEMAGKPIELLFQPHVGPFDRGILSSIYCEPEAMVSDKSLQDAFKEFYKGEQFVQILSAPPAVKNVAKTNYVHIFPMFVKGRVVVFSAIDNLIKGASGQAIQNMNIIFGLDETLGLK